MREGGSVMPNQSATNPSSEVLKNTRDSIAAREKIKDALEKLDEEIKEKEIKSTQEFASEVAKTGVSREQAVQKFNTWKGENERLATQRSAVQHFKNKIDELISNAKKYAPEDLVTVLKEEIANLRQTYSHERGEADALSKRIEALEKELAELELAKKKAQRTAEAEAKG